MRLLCWAAVAFATLILAAPVPEDEMPAKLRGIKIAGEMEQNFLTRLEYFYFAKPSKGDAAEAKRLRDAAMSEVRRDIASKLQGINIGSISSMDSYPRQTAKRIYAASFFADPGVFWNTRADLITKREAAQDAAANAEEMLRVWRRQARSAALTAPDAHLAAEQPAASEVLTDADILRLARNAEYQPLVPEISQEALRERWTQLHDLHPDGAQAALDVRDIEGVDTDGGARAPVPLTASSDAALRASEIESSDNISGQKRSRGEEAVPRSSKRVSFEFPLIER